MKNFSVIIERISWKWGSFLVRKIVYHINYQNCEDSVLIYEYDYRLIILQMDKDTTGYLLMFFGCFKSKQKQTRWGIWVSCADMNQKISTTDYECGLWLDTVLVKMRLESQACV